MPAYRFAGRDPVRFPGHFAQDLMEAVNAGKPIKKAQQGDEQEQQVSGRLVHSRKHDDKFGNKKRQGEKEANPDPGR